MAYDESGSGFIRRVEEDGPNILIGLLQIANNRITLSNCGPICAYNI
jgi:hypothetical protein